jgi:hypothetical protein
MSVLICSCRADDYGSQGMQPTLDAVSKALEFWETRKAAPGPGTPGVRRP